MARIDPLIESLLGEGGASLTLRTGHGVALALATTTVHPIKKPLSTQQIRASLIELATPESAAEISSGAAARFRYRHPKGAVDVVVTPEGDGVRAVITPAAAEARPAPPPEPVKAPAAPLEEEEPTTRKLRMVPKRKRPRAIAEERATAEESEDEVAEEIEVPGPAISLAPTSSMLPDTGVERTGEPARSMDRLLDEMIEAGASDVHLSTGAAPFFRVDGDMIAAKGWPALPLDRLTAMIYTILPRRNRQQFESKSDTDCAWESSRSRFRVNVFQERHGIGAVIRQIPNEIRTAEQMGLPKAILDLCALPKGLVLVTGPTGSGKSTTLAGMIDYVNRTRNDHIITIEDPVEFVHPHKKCVVHQREVGVHTESFKTALRAALREDPDVVLVGEMRDLETVAIAIETAETGHLVFGTLHTNTAPSTVDRIIDQFPADRQPQIRTMLSETLKAVITQTLCKKVGGGRIPALEVLMVTPAVSNLIREGKTFQIPSVMQTGRSLGMITQADALFELVRARKVDAREALAKAVQKGELRPLLERAGLLG
jgi:twitching motility protein PilT